MDIRRIDEETVRCIVTEEDLTEYGLGIDDFFSNGEKSREFLENIVEQAQKEVGYQVKNGMLAMQVIPLPKNGLAITFSETGGNKFKNMFDQIQEEAEKTKEKKTPKATMKIAKGKQPKQRIFCFRTLFDVEEFCCVVPNEKIITSKLYKDESNKLFYLVINKGKIAADLYNRVCESAIEFADFTSEDPIHLVYCEEHYSCLIKKKAIDVMRQIARSGK